MNDQSAPLITVIIAVFNGSKTLQQCIDSVTNQSYSNKQLIIIDGSSTDGTIELLKANNQSISYWISEPDFGIYHAWNKGLMQVNGEWICFLGADDYFWDDLVLARMSEYLVKLPANIRVAYSQIMLLSENGQELYLSGEPWQKVKKRFKQLMSIPHPGTMHRRDLFEQHGYFDESFRIAGDYELLLRELKTADAEFIADLVAVGMLQGGISSNPKNTLSQLHEVRRAQQKHGLKMPSFNWLMAVFRVYVRLFLLRVVGETATRSLLDMGRRIMNLPPHWTRVG
jgi:glycosyltransferase involved in cell wall biosynthesis